VNFTAAEPGRRLTRAEEDPVLGYGPGAYDLSCSTGSAD
jgi:hypothetical protein